jgi:hypothetical protein
MMLLTGPWGILPTIADYTVQVAGNHHPLEVEAKKLGVRG